jgi:hypothetical protein
VLKHSLIILEGREVCILTRSANTINENPVQTYSGNKSRRDLQKKSDMWARRNLNNLN